MKVLITTDWYHPVINGVVTSVMNLKEMLEKNGHEVRVLTLSSDGHSQEQNDVLYLGSLNVNRIYPNARVRLFPVRRWLEKIARWQPDIVHSQCEFSTFGIARKIATLLDIPLVHTYHTIYEDYTHYFSPNRTMGRKAAAAFSRHVLEQCDRVIAPTEKVRTLLETYKITRPVDVVPTGISLEKFTGVTQDKKMLRRQLGLPEDAFLLMYVGRLAREKNVDLLIRAMTGLKGQQGRKKCCLVIVGGGPDEERLKAAAKTADPDAICFTGMVSADMVPLYYHAGDVFVTASSSETQGLTYVEALASGLPVICMDDACIRELVRDGMNGFLYRDLATLKLTLQMTATLPQSTYDQLAAAALTSALPYRKEAFGEAVLSVYEKALREHGDTGIPEAV